MLLLVQRDESSLSQMDGERLVRARAFDLQVDAGHFTLPHDMGPVSSRGVHCSSRGDL